MRAIRDAPIPRGISELKAYLGMLTYYSKFLPDRATLLALLHALLQKGATWKWSEDEDKAFQESKWLLTSSRVLVHYNTKLPLLLTYDASPFGLGAVLSHRLENGNKHPIVFASRSLSPAEKIIHRLTVKGLQWFLKISKFHLYIYGRHFKLLSDHQPLKGLLGEGQSIPVTASARIQRWALLLAGYQYTFRYKAGKRHNNADALSRVPLLDLPHHTCQPEAMLYVLEQLEKLPVTATQIAWWTTNDPVLSQVRTWVREGWPQKVADDVRPYKIRSHELSVEADCVVWGTRVVIPPAGRRRILTELHEAHPGAARIKGLARGVVWWPSIDVEVEQLVRKCEICQMNRPNLSSAPLHPWEWPKKPWSRVHVDYAGPFLGSMFLVVVDARSKWIEVYNPGQASAGSVTVVNCDKLLFNMDSQTR